MSPGREGPRSVLTGGGHLGDDGSAVVDFVLVGILVIVLALGVMQVAFALHVRNTLAAAAADGARFGANADRGPQDGVARTRAVITQALSARFAGDVTADYESLDGVDTVVVAVRAPLPVLGPLGPSRTVSVRGHALVEAQ